MLEIPKYIYLKLKIYSVGLKISQDCVNGKNMLLGQHCTKLTWVYHEENVPKCFASILFSGKLKLRKVLMCSPNTVITLGKFVLARS